MSEKLHILKCTPCSRKTPKLNDFEIDKNLNELKDWTINKEREMIFKKYNFKDFKSSLKFANLVGVIAQKEFHHPDMSVGYGYCLILIHTKAINGLSINDFILASKINSIKD